MQLLCCIVNIALVEAISTQSQLLVELKLLFFLLTFLAAITALSLNCWMGSCIWKTVQELDLPNTQWRTSLTMIFATSSGVLKLLIPSPARLFLSFSVSKDSALSVIHCTGRKCHWVLSHSVCLYMYLQPSIVGHYRFCHTSLIQWHNFADVFY